MSTRTYEPSQQQLKQLNVAFTFHPPKGDQAQRYAHIRDAGRGLAEQMLHLCPQSRELSLALTNVEQAIMWANAAIARNEGA